MRIAIVGAGMAGLSCADGLAGAGHSVILFDKGRGPGGRMASRRIGTPLGEVSFDHGAQYFTARDPGFRQQVDEWAGRGVVAPWPLLADDAWVGAPSMNAPVRDMASRHEVRWSVHVDRLERGGGGWLVKAGGEAFAGFDGVVLAVPPEQAVPFLSLHDFAMAREAMLARSQPCWSAMFAFAGPLPGGCDIVRDVGPIAWAARNAARPGRAGPEGWVVQARGEWSKDHLDDDPERVTAALLVALASALGADIPAPIASSAHRWRYAMSAGVGHGALWNERIGIGLCADWLLGPRVECAWLSGRRLAAAMLAMPVLSLQVE